MRLGWVIFLVHVALMNVTCCHSASRWDALEVLQKVASHVWHLGGDGWKAKLS